MKYCPFCGSQIKRVGKFCTSCGKKFPTLAEKNTHMSPEVFNLFVNGVFLQAEGRLKEAIEFYDAALKINPNIKEIQFNIEIARQLLERDDNYIRSKIMKEKPESQQRLLNVFYEVEEIVKSSLRGIPSFQEEIEFGKEDMN